MLTKYAISSDIQLELLNPGDRVKTAGALPAVQAVLSTLAPDPLYTYALVNAMGFSEFYGPNSNADWYGYCPELDYNGLLHAWPDIGVNVEADRTKGRYWTHGYPCFYGATVYAHHKNTCPTTLGFGDVTFVFANPEMKRIELLLRINNEEARKKGHEAILARIAAGDRCDVSMGAKIPWDACSICTDWGTVKKAWATFDPHKHAHPGIAVLQWHKKSPIRGIAVTAKDYCSCLRTMKNQILPDGRKVFMYNIFPRFFDISCVFIGADKTARVMWHLAHSPSELFTPKPRPIEAAKSQLEEFFGLKVAELTKEILDAEVEGPLLDAEAAPAAHFELLGDPHDVLSSAASMGIVLSPKEFGTLLGQGDFDPTCGEVDDSYAVSPGHVIPALLDALRPMLQARSAFAPYLSPRLQMPAVKTAQSVERAKISSKKLAAAYNGYRLSVLERCGDLVKKSSQHLLAGTKVAMDPEAALLLGIGPAVQLLASHFNRQQDDGKQLGTMAKLIAENPTFLSLAMFGAGLRLAMKANAVGGIIPAILSLVR